MTELPTSRPFSEMRSTGLLWLINTSVFHPRGYALGFEADEEGNVIGWTILGDGQEVWLFDDSENDLDNLMRSVKDLLP